MWPAGDCPRQLFLKRNSSGEAESQLYRVPVLRWSHRARRRWGGRARLPVGVHWWGW